MERKKVILLCDVCLSRNYSFFKAPNNNNKLEMNKYCSKCNKYNKHKETR